MKPARTRRGEYTEATRRALLDSAEALFAERGYRQTSLDEIAAAARVTKGAIYHHFSGKNVLFETIIDRLESGATAQMREAFEAHAEPLTGALAALDRFLLTCSDPVYGALVFREGPIALGWERWRECEEKYAYALVAEILQAMAEAGRLTSGADEALPTMVFGMLGSAGQLLARAPGDEQPRLREQCRIPVVALLTGLGTLAAAPEQSRIQPEM